MASGQTNADVVINEIFYNAPDDLEELELRDCPETRLTTE
ncbi:hypothetical protein Poly41_38600 [Novipirellula artificiosorum]|uniref:Uncharacterized protein n=1 Tax=Novipirellula artificiosorum TaxID=2528016 RepID=A0A5C6DJM1_9BACT|nr:hypothetical protein Poly41_38600 [Novipirellula artificiosorum]